MSEDKKEIMVTLLFCAYDENNKKICSWERRVSITGLKVLSEGHIDHLDIDEPISYVDVGMYIGKS